MTPVHAREQARPGKAHVEDFGAPHDYASFHPNEDIRPKSTTIPFWCRKVARSVLKTGILVYLTRASLHQRAMIEHTGDRNSAFPTWDGSMLVDPRDAHGS
jgi:hypothetical protein